MAEVLLKAVCEMHARASRERDSTGGQLRATVQRAAGRAVLTWVERIGRDAMRYEFGVWKQTLNKREMEELRSLLLPLIMAQHETCCCLSFPLAPGTVLMRLLTRL